MEETKKCPYCAEEILATAKKCKYCGEWLDGSHPHVSNHGHNGKKKVDLRWVGGICAFVFLCGIAIYFINKTDNKSERASLINEETEQRPSNPLDINGKTVFKVKYWKETYIGGGYISPPPLGYLSEIVFYSDTTGLLIDRKGERSEIKCRYIEGLFHDEFHKVIMFEKYRNIFYFLTENFNIYSNTSDKLRWWSDAKDAFAAAEESKNSKHHLQYTVEKE